MGKFPRKIQGYKIVDNIDNEELFETEQDALDSIEIEDVTVWECIDCKERYDYKDDAYHCCE